jgi:hypothetical protein
MTNAGDISSYLDPIGQPNSGHFAEGRIGLLGRLRIHTRANPSLLRGTLQRGTGRLVLDLLATFANKLIYGRHCFPRLSVEIDI